MTIEPFIDVLTGINKQRHAHLQMPLAMMRTIRKLRCKNFVFNHVVRSRLNRYIFEITDIIRCENREEINYGINLRSIYYIFSYIRTIASF